MTLAKITTSPRKLQQLFIVRRGIVIPSLSVAWFDHAPAGVASPWGITRPWIPSQSPDLVLNHLDICWCSPLVIGFIPSPLLLVVEQPLANAKATASPKQRLILVRSVFFVFITLSFILLLASG